jgi:O-antigen/teichoic acid export membrane protein
MGVLAVFQWPVSFYQGGLMGLRKQVLFNVLRIIAVTASNGGAVLVLWLISPTIQAFFLWLVAVSAVQVGLLTTFLWKSLPPAARAPQFDFGLVRNIGRFAAGMSGITLIGLALTQIDKIVVSKLLPLKMFGYYALAWAVANGLLVISGAVFNVVFPHFSAQVAAGDERGTSRSYHRDSQLMAVIILPAAALLSLFSFDILRLWTRSNEAAHNAAPILSVLVIGSALNALLYLPYALQLAYGWTRLSLFWGFVSMAIFVPAMLPMTRHFGTVGAATVWAALNILSIFVVVPIMHRRLLPGEAWGYFCDVGLPLACALLTAALGRIIFPNISSTVMTLAVLSGAWISSSVMAVLAAPLIRSWALTQAARLGPRYVG